MKLGDAAVGVLLDALNTPALDAMAFCCWWVLISAPLLLAESEPSDR